MTPGTAPFVDLFMMDTAGERPNVLVVEDDDDVRAAMCDVLEMAGYNAVAATDGFEALICSRLDHPDLIVLDLALPELDGWQFLRRRSRDDELRSIPVCIVTGYKSDNPAREFPEAAYLAKPINVSQFLGTVQRLCKPGAAAH